MTRLMQTYAGLTYYSGDEVYPVSRITAGTVGELGRRTFVLQAHVGEESFSWVIEKDQALGLSRQIPELLDGVREQFPELGEPLVAAQPNLALSEPLQPLFRVGSIGVAYDRIHDFVVFTLFDADAMEVRDEDLAGEMDDDEPAEQQIFLTRGQALLLSKHAGNLVVAGRPLCPGCGLPIDDEGHFCPPPQARGRTGREHVH